MVFGHFIKFRWFDWSDNACNDSAKCFWTFGSGYRACIIDKPCIRSIINGKKEPKMRFLVFISGLVGIMPSLVRQHHSVVAFIFGHACTSGLVMVMVMAMVVIAMLVARKSLGQV